MNTHAFCFEVTDAGSYEVNGTYGAAGALLVVNSWCVLSQIRPRAVQGLSKWGRVRQEGGSGARAAETLRIV